MVGSNIFENKVYNTKYLLKLVKEKDDKLDLMLLNDKLNPPIVKIININKYIYKIKKKYKNNFKVKLIKIIRLSPNISSNDFNFKINLAKKFLKKNKKVKFYVYFKGRSIIYKDQGKEVLINCSKSLNKYGIIEKYPYMDNKRMFMILKPNKKNYK
ncbi:MAG: translation initiation factor IF-3 [Candidatus Shikimatogenerans bostrichidophilus]|nr:MAG: translation initiation factor IF-3 [Candidatus Shikimatogenerans bostrichidophilus]